MTLNLWEHKPLYNIGFDTNWQTRTEESTDSGERRRNSGPFLTLTYVLQRLSLGDGCRQVYTARCEVSMRSAEICPGRRGSRRAAWSCKGGKILPDWQVPHPFSVFNPHSRVPLHTDLNFQAQAAVRCLSKVVVSDGRSSCLGDERRGR